MAGVAIRLPDPDAARAPAGGHATVVRPAPGIAVEVRVAPPTGPDPADFGLLDDRERARVARRAQPVDRARLATGRRLLRHAVAERAGVGPASVVVRPVPAPGADGPGGRPTVPGGPVGLSVAHGGGLVLVALCDDRPVGIDVEPVTAAALLADGTTEVLLGDAERRALPASPGPDRDDALLAAWTRKEAVLKALGVGLTVDPRRIVLDPSGAARVVATAGGLPDPDRLLLVDLDLDLDVGPAHRAALAVVLGDAATAGGRAVRPAGASRHG